MKIALFFRSGLREDKRIEMLQKDLELLAGNQLFVHSSKLSTI
jgi:hypothetical protein